MGNVREEGINMYLTDNYTPKMNQLISVTETFRRATVSVSLSTNVMASSIKNSMASASSSLNNVNSSIRKLSNSMNNASSFIEKMSLSIGNASSAGKKLSNDIDLIGRVAEKTSKKIGGMSQKGRSTTARYSEIKENSKAKNDKSNTEKPKKIETVQEIVQIVKQKTRSSSNKMETEKLGKLKNKIFNSSLIMDVKGSSLVQNTLNILGKIKNNKWVSAISVKDLAKNVLSGALSKLKQFTGRVWSGAISIKDKASGIIGGIKDKMSDLTNGFTIESAVKKGVDLVGQGQNQKAVLRNVMERNKDAGSKRQVRKDANDYYETVEALALDSPFDPKDVVSMGTKAMMITGNTKGAKKMTQAMVDVRALNMDTTSEQDVSAAFVSASKGNMEALNTLVGENYKTLDEALIGIRKKQGGLALEMSHTIPGLLSGAATNVDLGLRAIIEPFDTILGGGIGKVSTFIEGTSNKLAGFSQKVANVMNSKNIGDNKQNPLENKAANMIGNVPRAIGNTGNMIEKSIDFTALTNSLLPVVNLVNGLLDSINNKSPIAQGIISIFGTVVTTAFQLIGPVVEAVSPIITSIFSFLGERAPQINNFIETLGIIWKTVWETLGPLLETGWKIIEPLLSAFFHLLDNICNMVKDVCEWWKNLVDEVKNNPITGTISTVIEQSRKNYENDPYAGTKAGDSGKTNAFGLNYVPYNDYFTRLHEGEMVLTKQEANQYRNGQNSGNVSISKLADTIIIREEADIEKVTSKLVASIQMAQLGGVL